MTASFIRHHCGTPSEFDPESPCKDLPDRPAPCVCWLNPEHVDDHACRCGNTWTRPAATGGGAP